MSIVAQSIIIKSVPRTSGCWRTRTEWMTKRKMKSLRRAAQLECKCEIVNMRSTGKEMLRGRKTEDKNEYGDSIEE